MLLLICRWSLRLSTVPASLYLLIKTMWDTENYQKQMVSLFTLYMLYGKKV